MKIIRYHEKGPPEVMKVEDDPMPVPGPGEVLIKIQAAGIAYGDVLRRSGKHYPLPTPLPHTPGGEVVGVIEGVGEGVDPARIGQSVSGHVRTGGYAQYGVGPDRAATPLPPTMPDPTLVLGLGGQGMTAALVLKLIGKLQPGESVLVPAAAGAVGSLAVQLAKIYGAGRVIALASTPAKRELALSLGADAAVDYTVEGWSKAVIEANGGVGVDLALEMTGGPTFYETIEAIKAQRGRMVVFGNASDQRVSIAPDILLARNMTISGFMMGGFLDMRREIMPELMGYVREGRLKPQIGGRYALADTPEAHRALETRTSTGKLLIEPWK